MEMPLHPASSRTKGYLIALIATIAWSSTAIFIRYLNVNYQMPPLALALWRDLIVSLAIGAFAIVFRPGLLKINRKDVPFFVAFGGVLAVFNSTWTISVAFNGAAVSTVLAYSSAAFTALLGWKLFGESLNWVKLIAVFLSMLGCVFVSGAYDITAWRINPIGIMVGLLSGLAFALYSIFGRRASELGIQSLTTLFYSFTIGSAFLWVINALSFPRSTEFLRQVFWLGSEWKAWIVLVVLALGPTIGGYGLYIVSLGYLPASIANLIATLEPGMTAILAFFILGERLSPVQFLGSGLVLIGLIFLRLYENRSTLVASAA